MCHITTAVGYAGGCGVCGNVMEMQAERIYLHVSVHIGLDGQTFYQCIILSGHWPA